jgi:hypothetical protein
LSKLLRFALCGLAFITLQACQKFSKSFQEKAFTCGLEPDQYQNSAQLLQIVDAENQPLNASRLQTLQIGLQREGSWQNLQLSRGGCVVVGPADKGDVVVQDPLHDESAYLSLESGGTGFSRLPLKKRRSFSMRFSCPSTAYAADDRLQLNAFYAGDGEAKAGLWLSFAAQKSDMDEPALILWNAALDRKAFPENLNVQNLPAGTYRLTARAGYLKPGQDPQELEVLGNREGCPLEILRDIPDAPKWRLTAHTADLSIPPDLVVAVGQSLDLMKDPEAQLEYCVEHQSGALQQCVPQTQCKGSEASFTQAESISLPKAGQWAVFARHRDAAGHVSALSCARVQVSDSAPAFSVTWKEADWNQPFPLVALPPLKLEAEVTDLKHETVGVQYVEESLECRVTVTSALGNSRDAYYGRCLSGRCQGRAFRDWQPCSKNISIDMSQEWLRSENWESSVSLHVRASDQAGHARVLRKNLWFSGQRLLNKRVTHPLTQEIISRSSQLLKRKDGSVLATANGFILQQGSKGFEADPAISRMLGTRPPRQLNLFEDPNGVALWGFWTFHDQAGPVLGKKVGDSWIFQPNADQGGPAQSCENFGQNHQGLLLCLNGAALVRMDAQHRWQSRPLVDQSGKNFQCESSAPLNSRYTEDASGRWFLCNAGTLLFQAEGQGAWQRTTNTPLYLVNFRNILKARNGELWLLGDQGSTASKVYAWKDGAWEDRSEGLDEPWYIRDNDDPLSDLENFHELADGSLRFGVQTYDRTQKKWLSMLPDTLQKYEGVAEDSEGGLWTVVEDKALLRFYPKPLILPLEMLGLLPGSRLASVTTVGSSLAASFMQTGHIMIRGSAGLFHLESQPWQNLPFGFVRTPAYGEAWIKWFKDPNGNRLVLREDWEIARLDPEQGWTVLSLPSDRPPALKKNFTLIPEAKSFLARVETGLVWLWDLVSFREYPLKSPDGVEHDLRSAEVDGLGQIWEAQQGWNEPFRLYRLKDQTWEPYLVPDLPDSCSGPIIFFEGDKLLVSCGTKGPAIVHNQSVSYLATHYPELPWSGQDFQYWMVPSSDKHSPFVFFTVFDYERQEQTLHRFEPGTGGKKKWTLIDDRRLHFRGDILTPYVGFERLAIDPRSPDHFLISSFRFILRPDGDTLKVAVDGRKLLASRGIKEEPLSGVILGLDIERSQEVWILMKELGLLRYDTIWKAEDKDESPVPRF